MFASHEVLRKRRLASGWHWWEPKVTQRKSLISVEFIVSQPVIPSLVPWLPQTRHCGMSEVSPEEHLIWACSFQPFFPGRGSKSGG